MEDSLVQLVEGSPRVRDTDLGAWLGFSEPRAVRRIIERWSRAPKDPTQQPAISPHCRVTVTRQLVNGGGSRAFSVSEFWLSEEEALFIAAKSETSKAVAVTKRVIAEFVRARHALVTPSPSSSLSSGPTSSLPDPLALCARLAMLVDSAPLALATVRAQSEPTIANLRALVLALTAEQARWLRLAVSDPKAWQHGKSWAATFMTTGCRVLAEIEARSDDARPEPKA